MDDYWTPDRVALFDLAVRGSDFPRQFVDALAPILTECRDAVDVGAGVGTLTLPLARRLQAVTALEPAPAMLRALQENLRRSGLTNVTIVPGKWEDAVLAPHDVVLAANVSPIFEDLDDFLHRATALARRAIALVQNVGPGADKFYFGELYPLLLGRPYPPRRDYLDTVTALHGRGLFANVRVVEYDFDQPFADLCQAVEFWTARMGLAAPPQVRALEDFLRGRLRPHGSGVLAPMRRRSAVLWWRTS
jgi:SAM-dependent methyltransferase